MTPPQSGYFRIFNSLCPQGYVQKVVLVDSNIVFLFVGLFFLLWHTGPSRGRQRITAPSSGKQVTQQPGCDPRVCVCMRKRDWVMLRRWGAWTASKVSLVRNRFGASWTGPDVTTANPFASDSGCLLLKACYLPLNFQGGLRRAFPYFSVFHLIAADKSAATAGKDMIIQAAL